MRQLNRLAAAAGILAVVTAVHADTIAQQRSFDLSRAGDPTYFQNNKTTVLGIGTDDEGLTCAHLYMPSATASLGRTSTTKYEDWSGYNILSFKLKNNEKFACTFKTLVYLTSSPTNGTNMFSASFTLLPGEERRYCAILNPLDPSQYGLAYMRPALRAPYNNLYSGGSFRNLKTIYTWRLSYQGSTPAHIDVSDLRLIQQSTSFDNMVDAFGQYSDREWPGKVHQTSDLQANQAAEMTDLAANPDMGEEFGTTKLPNANPATGQWEVVQDSSGNYFLQHPNGNLFWSLGVSAVHNGMPTPVGGRENYYQSLPDSSGEFASCFFNYGTPDGANTCYSFHLQNLMLKYGNNYMPNWVATVKQRLGSWGINTLGIQCLTPFYDNSMPFTQVLSTSNFKTRLRLPHQIWGTMPDPFDTTFQSWMATNFQKTISGFNAMTNFMGVYVDNELSWGNLSSDKLHYNIELGTFKAPATQPAKIAMVNWLNNRYNGSISALNSSWKTNFSSFNSILTTSFAPTTYTTGMAADFV